VGFDLVGVENFLDAFHLDEGCTRLSHFLSLNHTSDTNRGQNSSAATRNVKQ
jgi:hypothetical protein